MKLQNELSEMIKRFTLIKGIDKHVESVRKKGNYNNLEARIAWDCLHFCYNSEQIEEWYDKYKCNDSHIETVAKLALRSIIKL
jgi:hypothetical protein